MLFILSHPVRLTRGIARLRKAQSTPLSQTVKAIPCMSWTMPEELEGSDSVESGKLGTDPDDCRTLLTCVRHVA